VCLERRPVAHAGDHNGRPAARRMRRPRECVLVLHGRVAAGSLGERVAQEQRSQ
jgi:hypothetical protein